MKRSPSPRERVAGFSAAGVAVPIGLLVLAALLRLPALATRGTWDGDQAHDMLVLRALVQDRVLPLLGPPTSIGDVHHGALYYYLLSPAAFLTGGDSPLAVVTLIALAGIAAVLVTWWLARSIGGDVAGLAAGLAMAVSTSAVDESTFIWNPNLIALSSAIALAGAWHAWTSRDPRWWLLAGVGTAVTMQCHILGVTILPVIGALVIADARSRSSATERGQVWRFGSGGLLIVAASFIPLLIHELSTGGSEVRAALAYVESGGDPTTLGPLARLLVVGARVVSWPLTGLFTDAPFPGLVAVVVVIVVAIALARFGPVRQRQAARWIGLGLAWTALALAVISPSLATVVPGLPNDHYHAFADPMVFVLVGLGIGALWRGRGPRQDGAAVEPQMSLDALGPIPRVIAVAGMAMLIGWNATHQPPVSHPDGGFPAAELAARRILAGTSGETVTIRSIPDFKSPEAYAYPLVRDGVVVRLDRGRGPIDPPTQGSLVVVCDGLFERSVGAACGGPAEAQVAPADRFGEPIDRFLAAPGRTISIYRPGS